MKTQQGNLSSLTIAQNETESILNEISDSRTAVCTCKSASGFS